MSKKLNFYLGRSKLQLIENKFISVEINLVWADRMFFYFIGCDGHRLWIIYLPSDIDFVFNLDLLLFIAGHWIFKIFNDATCRGRCWGRCRCGTRADLAGALVLGFLKKAREPS